MQLGTNIKSGNELLISLDWLSFTDFLHDEPIYVCRLLGYSMDDFTEQPRGAHGYNKLLRNQAGVRILYDGRDDMGVHVDIPGRAVCDVLEHYQRSRISSGPFGLAYEPDSFNGTVLSDLFRAICKIGKPTRIDLAIDDKGNRFYSASEVEDIIKQRAVVTKFQKYSTNYGGRFSSDISGCTVYFGKRESDVFLRIYDKQYEQNEKFDQQGENLIPYPWTRWELELKHSYAVKVADLFSQDKEIQEIAFGILSNYVRFIELDTATRKSRCKISEKWLSFLDGIRKIQLYVAPFVKTIDESYRWAKRQWAKTAAKLTLAFGDGGSWFIDLANSGLSRLTSADHRLIYEYQNCMVTA